jgi:hypothetical protein
MDPHQDVWSRWSGGDGAPAWTFEKLGMDTDKMNQAGAAITPTGCKETGINNPALKGGVCCSNKVLHSGFNTFLTALKGGVLNPSARIKKNSDSWVKI